MIMLKINNLLQISSNIEFTPTHVFIFVHDANLHLSMTGDAYYYIFGSTKYKS